MPRSKHKIVKDGWGSRSNFQASHGLGTTPGDLEEGNKILEEIQRHDTSPSQQNIEIGESAMMATVRESHMRELGD